MKTQITKSQLKSNIARLLPYLCIILMALVVLFNLISKQQFWTGRDTYFHMNGIYEDAMQIKTGHFSYFISMFGFDRSGRIVNALYGPAFSYLCGALLLLCHSWVTFEFILFLITLVVCGFGVYWCSRQLRIQKPLATILALFYMISYPVLTRWIGGFEFTGLGAAILVPFVIKAGVKMIQQRRINVVPLAVLMAVCLQIHLMTSLIAGLTLVPFALCGWLLSTHRIRMIKSGLLAAVLSFCLSGNIFGAIYDVYSTNHLIPTFPNFNLQATAGYTSLNFNVDHITVMGRLYTAFLVIAIVWMIIKHRSVTVLDWCMLIDDVLFLILSSTYFPWNQLVRVFPSLASIIQFPSRFMSASFLLTLLLVGKLVSKVPLHMRWVIAACLAVLLVNAFQLVRPVINSESRLWQSPEVVRYWSRPHKMDDYSSQYQNGDRVRAALRSPHLSKGLLIAHKITADYIPTPHAINLSRYYDCPVRQNYVRDFSNQQRFHKWTKNHELLMNWRSSNRRQMRVPLMKYGKTVVTLNHQRINPRRSVIGTMKIKPRKGPNHMTIRYQPGIIFKLLSWISVISWLGIIIDLIHHSVIKRLSHEN